MKLVAVFAGCFVLAACNADGEVKVKASSDEDTKAAGTFSAEGQTDPNANKTTATRPPEAAPATETTAAAAPAQSGPPACPLVCYVAQKGRAAPADEQRLAGDLSDALTSLRSCGPNNSLTLRFDSTSVLTEFGVDADRGGENSCVDSVRHLHPGVSYPGPSTLRCSERCGGEPVRSRRRR